MTDRLLSTADEKAELSLVYMRALAARAGYVTAIPRPDRHSVDVRIEAGAPFHPAIDIQLKATTTLGEARDGVLRFRLPVKNYRDLRRTTQTPRLLVVLELPRQERRWMTVGPEELVLRRRAYWFSLRRESGEVTNRTTVTIHIPSRNLLDVGTLRDLMAQSRKGEL